ncbi:MAG: hypothetical protein V1725_03845, partial [archaeon]
WPFLITPDIYTSTERVDMPDRQRDQKGHTSTTKDRALNHHTTLRRYCLERNPFKQERALSRER